MVREATGGLGRRVSDGSAGCGRRSASNSPQRTRCIGETRVATCCGASRTSCCTASATKGSSLWPAIMFGVRLIASEHDADG